MQECVRIAQLSMQTMRFINGKYQYHESRFDKTAVPLGTIQDILLVCKQVQVHRLDEELHPKRGVEGQVTRCHLEVALQHL